MIMKTLAILLALVCSAECSWFAHLFEAYGTTTTRRSTTATTTKKPPPITAAPPTELAAPRPVNTRLGYGDNVIIGGAQSDTRFAHWNYERLYDGGLDTDVWADQCFHSGPPYDHEWVDLYLNRLYRVDQVSLLNRGDYGWRSAVGVVVKVCRGRGDAANCQVCGQVATGPPGKWIDVLCEGGGLQGNTIRLEQHSKPIHICEVTFRDRDSMVITGGEASDERRDWSLDKLYDGRVDTNVWAGQCFHSGPPYDHEWVELALDRVYQVGQVSLLNRGDHGWQNAVGIVVKICRDGDVPDCEICGQVTTGPTGDWINIQCDPPIEGNVIRLEQHSKPLHICEVTFRERGSDSA